MRVLRVYSRTGCHLCELLIEELEPWCRASGVGLAVLDVDAHPERQARFGDRVPVVCEGDVEISLYPLNRTAVEAWLHGGGSAADMCGGRV